MSIDQQRLQLQAVGAPKMDDNYVVVPKTVRDTIFVDGGASFEPSNQLFTSASKNDAYKTPGFPSNSQAFSIQGINIKPYVLFSTTDSTDEASARQTYASFLENAYVRLQVEGSEILNEPLSNLVPWYSVVEASATDEAAAWTKVERRNADQGYKLPEPIVLGAGTTFQFQFNVNGTFTTEAVGTTNFMTWPNSGLTSSKGYGVIFDLKTLQIRERR